MYRQDNRSRLAAAQEAAIELLRQLPPGSEIAVLTTGDRNAAFTTDTISAAAAIRSLETVYVTDDADRGHTPSAHRCFATRSRNAQELYIFTDLTEPAWQIHVALPPGNGRQRHRQ